jgi:imidazolonepropionase-like amidohydrolase
MTRVGLLQIRILATVVLAAVVGCGCSAPTALGTKLVLTHGVLIDGTGAAPIKDATLVISAGKIEAAGPAATTPIPAGARTIDLHGGAILPGFIDAHVHQAFDESNLRAWAAAGVTTVRDEGAAVAQIDGLKSFRARVAGDPTMARLVSFGSMLTVPGGFGQRFASSAAEFRAAVDEEFAKGVDGVTISLEDGFEDGYMGSLDTIAVARAAGPGLRHGLPKPTLEELKAAVAAAHSHGLLVSGHLTQGDYLDELVDAGVDDVAHLPTDPVTNDSLTRAAGAGISIVTTFTGLDQIGATGQRDALMYAVMMRDRIVLGSDNGGFGAFTPGIPASEIDQMREAGMEPMDVIVASTGNAAHVCGLDGRVGVLAPGLAADVLVVAGDPLEDLGALQNVRLVIHAGTIIRDEISAAAS